MKLFCKEIRAAYGFWLILRQRASKAMRIFCQISSLGGRQCRAPVLIEWAMCSVLGAAEADHAKGRQKETRGCQSLSIWMPQRWAKNASYYITVCYWTANSLFANNMSSSIPAVWYHTSAWGNWTDNGSSHEERTSFASGKIRLQFEVKQHTGCPQQW